MKDTLALEKFFRPRSVAIVGASPQPNSPRNTIVKVLLKHGFAGRVYPISQSHQEVEGLAAYGSIAKLPEAPDVALVITPAEAVPGIIEECGANGIRNAIVFSAGFEEVSGGKNIAVRLAKAAHDSKVTLLGPNCQGIWSVRQRTMLTFSPAARNLEVIQHAPIAIISQSGALAGAIANALQASGIGCSYVVSVGNETTLDALDALTWIIEQDDVRVVALYIEGLQDASRILRIAERSRERNVQIVALKTGRSVVGQQATASHTGKIASSHAIYADILEQAGVISADSLIEALAAVEVLGFLRNPRPRGDAKSGVSVLSASGGAGALLADHSSELGVPMAEFDQQTVDRLDKVLPDYARKANPVDLTGQINTIPTLFKDACSIVVSDPATEAVVVQFSSSGHRYLQENNELFKSFGHELPVVLSFIGETVQCDTRRAFRDAGVLLASDPAIAMRAVSLLYKRRSFEMLPRIVEREPPPGRPSPADWAAMMQFLRESGVTPAPWIVMQPHDRAAVACARLTYPLVVKVLPSEAEHKTEAGLVKLRVQSADDVDRCAAELRRRVGKPDIGILVQEMVGEGVEVVLGCLRQTDFGSVLSIGSGGVAIELYRDVTYLALPVSEAQVVAALKRLKLWTLLTGFRGRPAADIDTLAYAAARFGDMFLGMKDALEFEVNPVIVMPRGKGVYVVDALVTTSSRA